MAGADRIYQRLGPCRLVGIGEVHGWLNLAGRKEGLGGELEDGPAAEAVADGADLAELIVGAVAEGGGAGEDLVPAVGFGVAGGKARHGEEVEAGVEEVVEVENFAVETARDGCQLGERQDGGFGGSSERSRWWAADAVVFVCN